RATSPGRCGSGSPLRLGRRARTPSTPRAAAGGPCTASPGAGARSCNLPADRVPDLLPLPLALLPLRVQSQLDLVRRVAARPDQRPVLVVGREDLAEGFVLLESLAEEDQGLHAALAAGSIIVSCAVTATASADHACELT